MTYDREKAIAELKALRPEIEEATLGTTPIFHYQIVVPAHPFDFIVLPRKQDLLVIKARASFNRDLAANIVTFCEYKPAEPTGLTVYDGFHSPGFSFECVTLVAPSISRCFKGESEYLADNATWAFPSYRCEFRDDPEGKDFDFLIGKGGRIDVMDWNRAPTPQAKIRLLTDWPGGMLAKRKKLGIVQWESLIRIATNIPPSEELLVANVEDDEIHILSTQDGFICSGAVSREHLSTEELSAILESFLLCQSDEISA
jgi:hypothetical protein